MRPPIKRAEPLIEQPLRLGNTKERKFIHVSKTTVKNDNVSENILKYQYVIADGHPT
jgi:hypothetical protein